MSRRRWAAAAAVIFAAAGCGKSSTHSTSSTSVPSGGATASIMGSLPPFSPPIQARIRQVVQRAMAAGGYPGMVVGIWAQGRGAFVQAFGQSSTSTHAPLSTSDWLRIGSITKTFTATVILQLVQQGKLALSDKVSQFEPQIPHAGSITIRELLNHTSGLQSNAPSIIREILTNPRQSPTAQQVVSATAALPLQSAPGSAYHYSDTGYVILGEIASKVTRTDIGSLIQRQVLAPLGLQHTAYAPDSSIPAPSAHGYTTLNGQRLDTTNWNFAWTSSAGAMASTIGDLRVYAQALATGNGLLSAATQQQRLRFVTSNVPGLSYGLGIFRLGSFLGHDGEVFGYDSIMLYSPSQQVTLIVLGTTSPDLEIPPPSAKVITLQVAQRIYRSVFPGRTLRATAGTR